MSGVCGQPEIGRPRDPTTWPSGRETYEAPMPVEEIKAERQLLASCRCMTVLEGPSEM